MEHKDDAHHTPILVLDGALGTTLESEPYNVTYSEQTPLWSSHLLLSAPETLASVHSDFVAAGADIVLSATYQASSEGFERTPRLDSKNSQGYDKHEATQYMRKAIDILSQATSGSNGRQNSPAVGLSLGAYGAILSPSQEFSGIYPEAMADEHALASWHRARLDVFRSEAATWKKVDYVGFETVRPLAEIKGIRRAANGIGKKWWISHVVPDAVQDSDIIATVTAMLEPGADLELPWGIGVNCTAVHKIADVERSYREVIRAKYPLLLGNLWFVCYPDGTRGEVYDTKTMSWVKAGEGALTKPWIDLVMEVVKNAVESNAWKGIIIGGCCKTLPKDIEQLRARVTSMQRN